MESVTFDFANFFEIVNFVHCLGTAIPAFALSHDTLRSTFPKSAKDIASWSKVKGM